MPYTVYKHTTPSNKVYIGITARPVLQRWQGGNGYRDNKYFYNAIKKYGWENIKHEIVAEGLTDKEAWKLEIALIDQYGSANPRKGYNRSTGGEKSSAGVKRTDEQRARISAAKKGKYQPHLQTEAARRKRSESLKKAYAEGRRTPLVPKGGKLPEEWNRKAIEARKGKRWGHHTDATKQLLREQRLGKPHKTNAGNPIMQMKDGEVIAVYKSIEEARRYGFKGRIRECCRGERETSSGYKWEYI